MRVLHLIPTFHGGGSETMLAGLACGLRERGLDVHVAYLSGGPNLNTLTASDVTLHALRAVSFYDPTIPLQILRLVRRTRPDIVQTWLTQMDILGGMPTQLLGVPHVLTESSSRLAYPSTWKNRLRERIGRGAAAIVANSHGGADYWKDITTAPCWVIPNGLPIDRIMETEPVSRADLAFEDDSRLILFAGRLHPEKNIETVARAMLSAVEESDAVAVFCGSGMFREELEQMVAGRGVGHRVRIMGFVPNVWSFMKAADVMVSVTPYEGRPNGVLEAMVCGCPVVVSDIPAHREILADDEALFVPYDDPRAIADAIIAVLSDGCGSRERAGRAANGIGMLSVARYAEAHHEVYDEIVMKTVKE